MAKIKMFLRFTADDLTEEDYQEAERLCPIDRLQPEELAIWHRIAPLLAAHDYLNDLFLDTLVEYCRVVHDINVVAKFIRENGRTYTSQTRNGLQIKNYPEVGHLFELRRMLRSYVSDFGLSPSARKALESAQTDIFDYEAEQENPFTQDEKTFQHQLKSVSTH